MPKVYLLAGHGGKDPGATAYGMREKDITLVIAKAAAAELKRHGVEVIMGRTEDKYLTFEEEVVLANKHKVDLAIFIHVNAGGGDGAEVWIYPGSVEGRKLAELCLKHIAALGQNIDRGVKEKAFYVLKYTSMPAILPEAFFIDNDKDNDIGDTKAEQEAFGVAYAKAALEYLGIPHQKEVKEEKAKAEIKNGLQEVCEVKLPVLGKGDEGKCVEALQGLLIYKGYNCGGYGADGDFGNGTEKSVKQYQKDNGLSADGIVGKKTWSMLLGV